MQSEIKTLRTWADVVRNRIDSELMQRGGNAPLSWYRELWAIEAALLRACSRESA